MLVTGQLVLGWPGQATAAAIEGEVVHVFHVLELCRLGSEVVRALVTLEDGRLMSCQCSMMLPRQFGTEVSPARPTPPAIRIAHDKQVLAFPLLLWYS